MPSPEDSAGEGVLGSSSPSIVPGDAERAVVGAALTKPTVAPDDALPKGDMRPDENRDDVESLDAREPGRKGEGAPAICPRSCWAGDE